MADLGGTSSSTTCISETANATCSSAQSIENGTEDGDHIKYLRQAIDRTINKCVSSVRLSYFAKNYPAVRKKNVERLKALHESYKQQLHSAMNTEIDLMIEKENIEKLLFDFQDLHKASAKHHKRTAWRPSGDPMKDIAAHTIPCKMKYKELLKTKLEEIERENKHLTGRLQLKRQNLLATSEMISEKREDIKKNMAHLNTTELSEFMNGFQPVAKRKKEGP